jgi:hypothetical protein
LENTFYAAVKNIVAHILIGLEIDAYRLQILHLIPFGFPVFADIIHEHSGIDLFAV